MYEYNIFNTLDSDEPENVNDISFLKKITKVFYSPTEVFKVINDNPSFKLVFILYVILSSIPKLLMYFDGTAKEIFLRRSIEEGFFFPPEMLSLTNSIGIVKTLIVVCVTPFLLAYIYNIAFSESGKASYNRILSVILYTGLISSIGGVMLLLINSLMGTEIILSPLMFFDQNSISSFLNAVLSQFEIFNFWRIITAVYAFSVVLKTSKLHALKVSGIVLLFMIIVSFIAANSVTNPIQW